MGTGDRQNHGVVVSEADLEKVIRRATELQLRDHPHGSELTVADVRQIGAELGLEGAHLEQALGEVRALALVPKRPAESEALRRLYGSAFVQVSRVLSGTPEAVSAQIEGFLQTQECLRRVRNQQGRSLWEPSEGFTSKLQRGMNFAGRAYELARARSVRLTIEAFEEEAAETAEATRVMVTLCADLGHVRAGAAFGWSIGAAAGMAALGFAAAAGGGLPLLLVAPVAAVAGLGLATVAAERTLRHRRRRLQLALNGLLDSVEQGEAPVSQGAVLLDKISRWFDKPR